MTPGPFAEFYASPLQSLYLLLVGPGLFLIWLAMNRGRGGGLDPERAAFVRAWSVTFAIAILLDPIVGGPVVRALGLGDSSGGTAVLFAFVLLGDYRVFALLYGVSAGVGRTGSTTRARLVRAAPWTALVPLVAGPTYWGLGLVFDDLPGQVLWLVYELAFLTLALTLRARWIPRHAPDAARARYLRAVLAFAATYYALWASADVLILLGLDLGFALRVIPNQLYYGLFVPFAWFCWFRD